MDEKERVQNLCEKIQNSKPTVQEIEEDLKKISNIGRAEWNFYSPLNSAVEVIHLKT